MKQFFTALVAVFISIQGFSQWNPDTFVNLEVAALGTGDLQTITTSDGKTWIAFYHNNGGNFDMRAQLLDVNGNKLLGNDGVLACDQTSGSATFVFNVCLDASDNLVIAFQYQVAGVNTAAVTKVNTDGSLPWGTAGVQLGAGLAPYPALLTTGEIAVAWNNNSPSTIYLQKISTAGAMAFGSAVPVTVGASLTTRGQIVANPAGFFTLVFQRKIVGISTTLYAQRYDNSGVAQWTVPLQVSTLTTSGARYYSIVGDGDVTFFGYYASSGSRFFSYVQRINGDGTIPWGANGSVFSTYSTGSDPYQQTTNIAHLAGSAQIWGVCTYTNTAQSQSGVYVQKFNAATGAVMLDPLGKQVFPISTNMDTQAGKLWFLYGTGELPLFITYDASYKIYLSVLAQDGGVFGGSFPETMSATTATLATPKGRFAFEYNVLSNQAVAVWYENRGTEYRPYAQNRNLNIIPVTLVDFRAVKNSSQVSLYWNTATEINNKGFYIERSNDGIQFKTIGFVDTKAATGNSNANLDYSFYDITPAPALNYYRLKQTDFDGKFSYSKTVLVRYDKTGGLYINNIYPTPATTIMHVSMEAGKRSNAILFLIDMNGKTVNRSPS